MQEETITAAAAKGAIPVGITLITVCGIGLQDWTYILTAIWFLILIGTHIFRNWIAPFFRKTGPGP